jgi:hypothetical protein
VGASFISRSITDARSSSNPFGPPPSVPPTGPVDEQREVVRAVTGRMQRLDPQLAGVDLVAVSDRLAHRAPELRGAEFVRDHRRADALGEPLDPDHVVEVVVGEQHMADLGALALDPLDQRVRDVVRVDQHAAPAGPIDDQVGIGEPLELLDALQDHSTSYYPRFPATAPA